MVSHLFRIHALSGRVPRWIGENGQSRRCTRCVFIRFIALGNLSNRKLMKFHYSFSEKQKVDIQPLFITVDPQRDTNVLLDKYTNEFSPKLLGLTGTQQQIASVCKKFRVYFSAGPKDQDDDYIVRMAGVRAQQKFYIVSFLSGWSHNSLVPHQSERRIRRLLRPEQII